MAKNAVDWIAIILLIIGGLNWGLYGLWQIDLVDSIFGAVAWLATTVYVLVGLAALYKLITISK